MIGKIYTSILILILFVLLYSLYIAYEYDNNTLKIYDHKIKIYDTFEDTYYKNPQDIIANDGKMKFNFLKDPYY